jgi:uncharacterized protein (TIGR02246 family)
MTGFDEVSRQYHRALEAFIQGDPEPVLALWSRQDDATLANPFGPPVRGWSAIRAASEAAASRVSGGSGFSVEDIARIESDDLAYEVEIHRFNASMGAAAPAPVTLRVTTVYRSEDDGWRVAHRHADLIDTDHAAP